VAQLFPNWLVVGIDDKTGGPIQDQRKVPKNFKYIRCYYDVLRTLKDMPSESFDLVLCRFMIFSYCDEGYKALIHEIERICKPGGYAEFNELDMRIYGNPKAGPIIQKLNTKGN
jgi:ubiquinone/menaquinone biosynthesis C-methylase UbiE